MVWGGLSLAVLVPVLTKVEAAFFAKAQPFGFILFARNAQTPDQLRHLTQDLRTAVGWHAPILIDQEGGRVARLRPPHWPAYPPCPVHGPQRTGVLSARAVDCR